MKNYFKGIVMSISMFSRIPVPFLKWDNTCTHLIIPFFPLVGFIHGVLLYIFLETMIYFGMHIVFRSTFLALFFYFITGFLHLDGFMDTSDAVLSNRSLEDKKRILKDSNVGAFSVIAVITLFIMMLSSSYIIISEQKNLSMLIAIPVISRCLTAYAFLTLSPMEESGYAKLFLKKEALKSKIIVTILFMLAVMASFFVFHGSYIVIGFMILVFYITIERLHSQFAGISGDLCGYALTVTECSAFLMLAII